MLGLWRGKGASNRYKGKMSASLRATADTWMMPSRMRFSSEA
ncbi:hypothetical protein [Streptomyces sp. NPDC018833]